MNERLNQVGIDVMCSLLVHVISTHSEFTDPPPPFPMRLRSPRSTVPMTPISLYSDDVGNTNLHIVFLEIQLDFRRKTSSKPYLGMFPKSVFRINGVSHSHISRPYTHTTVAIGPRQEAEGLRAGHVSQVLKYVVKRKNESAVAGVYFSTMPWRIHAIRTFFVGMLQPINYGDLHARVVHQITNNTPGTNSLPFLLSPRRVPTLSLFYLIPILFVFLHGCSRFENITTTMKNTMTQLHIHSDKGMAARLDTLGSWQGTGGILVMSYTMFRVMTSQDHEIGAKCRKYLQAPGPDLIIADEAHLLKNARAKARAGRVLRAVVA